VSVLHKSRGFKPAISPSSQHAANIYRTLLDGSRNNSSPYGMASAAVSSTSTGVNGSAKGSSAYSNSSGNMGNNSTSSSSTGIVTPAPSINPWFDHVLGGQAGSGSLLYQQINISSTTQPAGSDAENSEQDQPRSIYVPDPPLFEYPPAGLHPSVFFTAVLQEWTSPRGLSVADQVSSGQARSW